MYPKAYWFKATFIISVSVAQEFRDSFAGRLTQCLSGGFSQGISWGCVIWRLDEAGGVASKISHWHGCCPEASVSHHVDLSTDHLNVLMTWELAFPRVSDPRASKQDGSQDVFYDLVSELTNHHFCWVLWVTQNNPDMIWKGTTLMNPGGKAHWGPSWRQASMHANELMLEAGPRAMSEAIESCNVSATLHMIFIQQQNFWVPWKWGSYIITVSTRWMIIERWWLTKRSCVKTAHRHRCCRHRFICKEGTLKSHEPGNCGLGKKSLAFSLPWFVFSAPKRANNSFFGDIL